jgi:anti-sigma-K factor RskA
MPDVMNDDDLDALAAEYVLGTLDLDERGRAQVLLGVDQGFAANIRVWERRLGELHLMVEAVEPDAAVWTRVKARIAGVEPSAEIVLPEAPPAPTPPVIIAHEGAGSDVAQLEPRVYPAREDVVAPGPGDAAAGRVGRWRALALGSSVVALALAGAIAAWTFVPDRVPPNLRPPFGLGVVEIPPLPPPKPRPLSPVFDE